MTYERIEATLRANLKKTDRYGGSLRVTTGGKRTAPKLYVALPRDENREWNGFRVILGKTIRVDWAEGIASDLFAKKTASEAEVVNALEVFFARV